MKLANHFSDLAVGELFETLMPDFVLAFAFFTALVYAVLGKRFDRQRPAIVMSAVIGLSLAVGLGWCFYRAVIFAGGGKARGQSRAAGRAS